MFDTLLRIAALARKDLLAMFKDSRSRFSLIVPPIMQCLIYGYAATFDLTHVPYAVLDQDHSASSRQLIAKLDGTSVFDRVAELRRAADIGDTIDRQEVVLVLQIGQDFQRKLQSGSSPAGQAIGARPNSTTPAPPMAYLNPTIAA